MFEIGSSLREARTRRGLELDAVQRALRIRRRYLEALENDRFDQLPGEVYARGFLREYAEFLGLDGSLYVEEYNARYAQREELPLAAAPSLARPRGGRRLGIGLLAAAAVAAAAVGVAFLGRSGHGSRPPAAPQQAARVTRPAHHRHTRATTEPRVARLTLTAARGNCWLGIRVGSAGGPTLYWQTLTQGRTISFPVRRPLWVRIGAGDNLDATLGGKPLAGLPTLTGTLVVRA